MIYLKCLQILGFVIAAASSNTTTPSTPKAIRNEYANQNITVTVTKINTDTTSEIYIVSPDNTFTVFNQNISTNVTQLYNSYGKRRAIVTINRPTALRQRGRKRKSKKGGGGVANAKVESLLYEEYEADGTKLFEFMMYSMEDVTKFFASYLHTEICHVRCEPRPEDIAREEAKNAAAASTRRP